jgi:hypothetical protein
MAPTTDLVFNIAKGRVAELYNRVKTNDPANSVILVIPVDAGTVTNATMIDFGTLAAVLAGGVTERNTNGWARKSLDDTVIASLTVDNTNDRMPVDLPDQTWTAPAAAGGNTTGLIIAYDNDSTGGTDANIIPLTYHLFSITADGSDVIATINDFYRAS